MRPWRIPGWAFPTSLPIRAPGATNRPARRIHPRIPAGGVRRTRIRHPHPERSDVVAGGAGTQRPDRNRVEEEGKGLAGDALSPDRAVDPVGDLGVALHDEAGDAADEASTADHRTQRDVGRGPQLRHVGVERFTVVGILGSEGGHLDRLGVTHLVEQRVEVRIVDRPQCHIRHRCSAHLAPPRPTRRTYQQRPTRLACLMRVGSVLSQLVRLPTPRDTGYPQLPAAAKQFSSPPTGRL